MPEPTNNKIQIKEKKPEDHRTEEFFNLIVETFKEGLENKGIKEDVIKIPSYRIKDENIINKVNEKWQKINKSN